MIVLGIETTCDETAVSLLKDGRDILSTLTATQMQHAEFGGVVPEIAARAHLETLPSLYNAALAEAGISESEISGVAVACGPGLIGALLVGVSWAKGFSLAKGIPFIGVSHLEGHLFANTLEGSRLSPPFIALVVSGGHTLLAWVREWGDYVGLGQTRDDACGEAFDKVAKLLNLGYPGGPEISRAAVAGKPDAIAFPRAMATQSNFDFSYSGLKTAVALHVKAKPDLSSSEISDIAASFQEAAVEILVQKSVAACNAVGVNRIAVGGGVAANNRLRELLDRAGAEHGLSCHYPSSWLCTDNAAMIAAVGDFYLQRGARSGPALSAIASWPLWPRGKVFTWDREAQQIN